MRDFKHTMDVLVSAYFKGTLEHGSCSACAVGNIVEAAGAPRNTGPFIAQGSNAAWKGVFYTGCEYLNGKAVQTVWPNPEPDGLKVIQMTGYTVKELARIEYAFETAPKGDNEDDWMFNGLLAVLEVLADIHGIDFSGAQVYKKQLSEIHYTR